MKETLEGNGWTMYYECQTCGHKQYFSNPSYAGYEVRVRQKKQTFSIVLNNLIIGGPFWAYQLEEKMKKFGIYEV